MAELSRSRDGSQNTWESGFRYATEGEVSQGAAPRETVRRANQPAQESGDRYAARPQSQGAPEE